MTNAPNITVVILTYNEEVNIRWTLESVSWCDNVIVVDSYSSDRTPEICQSYPNVSFIQHDFQNYATQREVGISSGHVKHEWILCLDADEQVPDTLREELQQIATGYHPGAPVAYDTAMRLVMWGKWLRFSSEYPVYWRRFFLSGRAKFIQEGHADKLVTDGPVAKTQEDLIHWDHKGIHDWIDKHNRYSTKEAAYAIGELRNAPWMDLLAKDRARRRKSLKRLFRALPFSDRVRFLYLFFFRLGFLDGWRGYRFARLKAQQTYHVNLKIEELMLETGRSELDGRTAPSPGYSNRARSISVGER